GVGRDRTDNLLERQQGRDGQGIGRGQHGLALRSSGRRCATGKVTRAIKQDFRRTRGTGSTGNRKRAGDRRATVMPMRDQPDADAMLATRPRRQVGQTVMTRAVGWFGSWIVAKSETAVLGIAAERPAASSGSKRDDRSSSRA